MNHSVRHLLTVGCILLFVGLTSRAAYDFLVVNRGVEYDHERPSHLLEDQIQAEMEDVEELEIFLEQVEKLPTTRSAVAAYTA